ncbi:MAG: cytochrome c biogenesis protein ResB [Paludibacteraceae bacterium]|nr:cytochrome c biogenesis protein ResB [Paludibacteraceae bacterium]
MLESPISILLALVVILLTYLLRNIKIPRKLLISLMAALLVIVALMGTFTIPWLKIPLVIVSIPLMIISGIAAIRDYKAHRMPAFFSHAGFALIFCTAMCGTADSEHGQLILYQGKPQNQAFAADGRIMPLPFKVTLDTFQTDYYSDGQTPKMFRSILTIDGEQVTTEVNSPAHYSGYAFFQAGYDLRHNAYSIIEVVRDPWLPLVFAGMFLLFLGSLLILARSWQSWKAWIAISLVAVIFTLASIAKINLGTLMPALRNWLFVPHVIIYMMAYSIIAIVLIIKLFIRRLDKIADPLMTTASQLLIIGMIFGAVWARMAWGDYWTWDAKECWAAATWMASLAYIHTGKSHQTVRLWLIIITFAALQVTWYGVNYLPASHNSMHTYNT